jgi:hypothetical protein
MASRRVLVEHSPDWQPSPLPVDADGSGRHGFVCVHPLENGAGLCGGNVFDLSTVRPGETHCCLVEVTFDG